jgi:hypothetical protein
LLLFSSETIFQNAEGQGIQIKILSIFCLDEKRGLILSGKYLKASERWTGMEEIKKFIQNFDGDTST